MKEAQKSLYSKTNSINRNHNMSCIMVRLPSSSTTGVREIIGSVPIMNVGPVNVKNNKCLFSLNAEVVTPDTTFCVQIQIDSRGEYTYGRSDNLRKHNYQFKPRKIRLMNVILSVTTKMPYIGHSRVQSTVPVSCMDFRTQIGNPIIRGFDLPEPGDAPEPKELRLYDIGVNLKELLQLHNYI